MSKTKIGFIVYGVHKDGLKDPMGTPFIDENLIQQSKDQLKKSGLELVEYELVVASKQEAIECFSHFKKRDDIDALVLFSGTWVWASHLIGPIRDFATTGKGIVVWTHPGSQGWRPVGGFVIQGALKEIGIKHRFVYGRYDDPDEIEQIVSYCRASRQKKALNLNTAGVFGGRGMGQTCGVADPSQWMRTFGIDIDSRDTTELLNIAREVSDSEVKEARNSIQSYFSEAIPDDDVSSRSIRLYIALKKMIKKENWDMYTVQSFPGLGDDYSATCFAQSMMLNDRVATSTLSDFNTLLTVRLLNDLSEDPVYYGDLQHVDKSNNEIKIIGDGACPPSLAGEAGPAGFAEHGIPTEGEAGGLSVKLVCKPGDGIIARLGRTEGEFEMVFTRCTVFEPAKEEIEKRKLESGIPFWPHAFATAHCDIDQLLQSWNNEYAVLGYGEQLYEELIAFCDLTGIKAIAL